MEKKKVEDPREWAQLVELYKAANQVLQGLDKLELHQAAAYVSMAVETMKLDHPQLASRY